MLTKKSLTGVAKIFIQSEKFLGSWATLKKLLIEEFDVKIDSAQIHKLLMTRKKKPEEFVQENVLAIKEIGSISDIEEEVIIRILLSLSLR